MSLDAAGVVDLPELDDHLVEPETRYEMLDGELVYVPPADDPHASREAQICTLVTEGEAQGRAEGLAEGWAKGMAEAVVALLGSRGVARARAERERILGERDPARLERWISRAARCASADELLSEP